VTTAALTLGQLRAIDLFEGLEDAELERWLAAAQPFSAEPGEVLLEHAELVSGLVLLFEGVVETQIISDGRTEPVGRQLPPTWMGAIAALTEHPLGVRMQAQTECRLALIPTDTFVDLVLANRTVHQRIMTKVSPVMTRLTAIEASRERLASLGTMAAGLAHELNNPASAAKRAASCLVDAIETVNGAMAAFVEGPVERDDAEKLLVLQREALERAEQRPPQDAVAASDAEDAMQELLEDLDLPEAWKLAEPLAFLDAGWVRRVADVAGPETAKTLEWVAASLTARGLASELLDSAGRMSDLVSAVKSYAYMDRGGVVHVDVHEGLDSTLIMMGHKLKHTKITVERDYDRTLPQLTVRGSELNQVWTNLIHNAIQAIGERRGTITLRTSLDGPCVLVDIADDGPGIPPDARAHVLEPFFTTKPVGSGTGLGLDTARRIVEERHRGSLGFDTGDDGTVFHVWLPIEDTAR
jgi:signal transduction histidine kinase